MLDKEKFAKEIDEYSIIKTGEVFLVIALIEIRETLDHYIEQRIKSDKVIEGVLEDIQNNCSVIADDFHNLEVPDDFGNQQSKK